MVGRDLFCPKNAVRLTGGLKNTYKTNLLTYYMLKSIKSIEKLKQLANNDDGLECFILLAGGVKSSKLIKYDKLNDKFYIINYIDSITQELKSNLLTNKKYTNIGEVIRKNCFFAYC